MLKTVLVDDLKPGMYVVLPVSWFSHPFLKSQFLIQNQEQIDRIRESGISGVTIDTEKGPAPELSGIRQTPPESPSDPPSWSPENLIPSELREALHDRTMAPEKKAEIVYRSSRTLMERLLEDPKAENIREAKKGISEIVDLVIADDATAVNLLRITSYDFYTYTHSVNVGVFSMLLAKGLFRRSDSHDMHELGAGFFLHDIGKVRVDPAILNKAGRLTEEEMGQMRSHPYQGYKILSEARQLSEESRIIVMQHHEREDGTGYPNGLKGGDIHLYGRICCIADVYDALTAERSYKKRLTPFEALKIMREEMINHFHKDLFEEFVLLLG